MIRVVDAQTVNGIISIVVERRHWYWPWLRRCDYIAAAKRDRSTYSVIADLLDELLDDDDSYDWMNVKTGLIVSDGLAIKLTRAFEGFQKRENMIRQLEQGYDNVIEIDEKKRKGA
jgi:hypothetical protein